MPPVLVSAAAFAIALWAAAGFGIPAVAAEPPASSIVASEGPQSASGQENAGANRDGNILPANEDWHHSLASAAARAQEMVESSATKVPALLIALSAILALPLVALLSYLVHTAGRRKARRAAIRAGHKEPDPMEPTAEWPDGDALAQASHDAWLRLEGGGADTLPLAGHTIRIGRHHDNDIRLPDTTVHIYHAVIERTQDEAFFITDLSGKMGNGMRINGERLDRVQLSNGDVIELGRTRLKFESASV
jgi:hypothetical protein